MAIGVSYFGNRILRHVAADMEDLARRGFTGVLHTFSENDFFYYREQIARMVQVSHDAGLEVQLGPWGLGHTFGGEAESLFTAQHPEVGQVLSDGRRIGAGCPNQPAFRAFVRSWGTAAVEAGAEIETLVVAPGLLGESPAAQLVMMVVLIIVPDRRVHAVLVPIVFALFCYNHLVSPMFSDQPWVVGPRVLT